MRSPTDQVTKDVPPSEGSRVSITTLPVALAAHEPGPTCHARSQFRYRDDLTPQTQNEERRSVKLVNDLEAKIKSEVLEGDFQKRTLSVDESSIDKNESHSDPFDEMAVLDSEIRDDGDQRTITFRSVAIGVMVSGLGAAIAEVFMFKPVHVNVDILFLQIVCLILGHLFASIPGPLWWNPGPFDTKEAAFSVIMAASASAGVLGVEAFASNPCLSSSDNLPWCVTGRGAVSVHVKSINNNHEIIPTYLAPALSAISIWCLTLPKVPAITNLFGGSLPAEGMGLMAFSADWTLVGSHSPLFVPLLAQITDWLAYFGCIIIYSGAYTANWFNGGHLPFISYNIFDKDGHRYNLTAAVLKDGTGDAEVIERLGPPSFSTSFVLSKAFLCMAASASITIGGYTSIVSELERRKQIKLHRNIAKPCPHREITKKMRDFPAYAYAAILLGAIALAFLSCHLADSGLSPGGLTTSLVISFVLALASGYFYGTLGIHLFVAPVTQMLGGILFPGNAIGTMWFTMYGSTSVKQCVLMLKDLKLGTYMHLSPFSVVIAQLTGTVTGGLVHVVLMLSIVNAQREVLLMPNGNGIFTVCRSWATSQSTAWGLFSHAIYYPGKIYAVVLYCLFIGFFVPIPFIIHNRFRPHSVLAKFNVSLFIASLSHGMFGANSGRFTAVFVGFVSQFCVRKYNFKWYKTYNYILCAALDGGTQITVVALAFLLQGGAGFQVKIPTYFLNPQGPRDYCKLFNKNTSH
ncbi:hypothetical protein PCASD_12427 [Puccinia coronata f. sp. avenae]|uniref:OPT family small oligopeptide transporter n=1 Tax=Puccinia coronata f. sp. avenae TaxID=200324 RepID=A0A2N5U4Z8_9BASI|nr:hypothetical protein PCASD_12427 [Puccinia coronata f. sp. avenae]